MDTLKFDTESKSDWEGYVQYGDYVGSTVQVLREAALASGTGRLQDQHNSLSGQLLASEIQNSAVPVATGEGEEVRPKVKINLPEIPQNPSNSPNIKPNNSDNTFTRLLKKRLSMKRLLSAETKECITDTNDDELSGVKNLSVNNGKPLPSLYIKLPEINASQLIQQPPLLSSPRLYRRFSHRGSLPSVELLEDAAGLDDSQEWRIKSVREILETVHENRRITVSVLRSF